jgi:hypothetical protein
MLVVAVDVDRELVGIQMEHGAVAQPGAQGIDQRTWFNRAGAPEAADADRF